MLSIIRDFRRFVSVCFIVFRHPGWDIHRLRVALALYKTRKALCDLEDWQLRDIGLTCEDVMRECNRPLLADDAPCFRASTRFMVTSICAADRRTRSAHSIR